MKQPQTKPHVKQAKYSNDSHQARNNMKHKTIKNMGHKKTAVLPRKFKLKTLTQVLVSSLVITSVLFLSSPVQAQQLGGSTLTSSIKMPNTEYRESTIDLRAKVLGGEIKIERSWVNGRWYINPHWASLRFRNDPLNENVQSIDRAGVVYTSSGDGDLFVLEDVNVYIRKTENGWRWYDREGNWITYNQAGHATGYGDRNDVRVSFDLNGLGQITTVKDHHGQTVFTFVYAGGAAMPTQIIDREGRKVTYAWNKGILSAVTDVLGHNWLYGYDGMGQLASRIEPDGGMTQIKYAYPVKAVTAGIHKGSRAGVALTANKSTQREDPVVPVASITDRTGATTLINRDYDRVKRQFTVTEGDPKGNVNVSLYNHKGQLMTRTFNGTVRTAIERDGDYQEKITNERGLVTTVQLNERQQPVKIIQPDGSTVNYTYESTYGNLLSRTDALGHERWYTYDAQGNLTQTSYAAGNPEQRNISFGYSNSYGLPSSVTINSVSDAGVADSITLHQIYDDDGNLATRTDALGNDYHFTYNALGQILTAKNPLGEVWTYDYNAAGHSASMNDPLGHTTRYTTDAFGRITQKTDALGHESNYSYKYEGTGLVVRQSDALNQTTTYRYDSTGNLLSITSPSGDTRTWEYDKEGRRIQMRDAAGNITKIEYGAVNSGLDGMVVSSVYPTYEETYKYNTIGMPTQVTQILDGQEQRTNRISYDAKGQAVAVTDAAGRTSTTDYNAFGNLIKWMDGTGGQTRQSWDVLGNVSSVTDTKGNTHQFEYDGNSNRTKEITPSGQTTQFAYNVANQLTQRIDAVGNTTVYQYNAAGRVTQATYTDAGQSTPVQTVGYTYNAAGKMTEVVQKDASGNIQTHHVYTLDVLGRKTSEAITYGSGANAFTKTIGYAYDADGNLNAITYPDGKTQTYTYEHGHLKAVQLPNGQSMTWDGYQWQRPNQITMLGGVQTLSYDALQRSKGIEFKANNATLMNRAYTFDAAGNITERQTEDGAYSYEYDQLDRITQVTPPQSVQDKLPVEGFTYDAVHNRIGSMQQPGDWQYNADNQLVQFGAGVDQTTYTYTANGHVATKTEKGQTLTYTYDATDRLVRIADTTAGSTEIARYAYDPMGRRISKTVSGETTYYLYTDEGLIAELDGTGDMQIAYGWQPDAMYGTAPLWQAQVTGGDLQTADNHYLITDHLGTPQLAVNSSGQTTWKAYSAAFGNTTPDVANQITMNLRFPGQYFDQETNTHYNYFRDYDSATGRYVQSDPIGLQGGVNTYGYVNGNPLIHYDFFGLVIDGYSPDGEISPPKEKVTCQPNACQKKCVEEVVGEDISTVTVYHDPSFTWFHGFTDQVGATTRKETIYTKYDCEEFWRQSEIFLHEYYHVTKQWRTGELTRGRYLKEAAFRGGGARNKYEAPAYEFGRRTENRRDYAECLIDCEKTSCPSQ